MKKIVAIILVIILIVLVFPVKSVYKDGGSVQYKSITYTVIKYHILSEDSDDAYIEDSGIKILGVTVKDIENGYLD